MTITPILAENYAPLLIAASLAFMLFVIVGFICSIITASIGRDTWWGLALGIVITMLSSYIFFAVTAEKAPRLVQVAASFPLVCGLASLYFWGIGRKKWNDLVLRIVIYGSIIVGGLWLFALWVRQPPLLR
jgi:hypothetical protein